ncbi:hypothetical protein PG993_010874 [Apiospora rasikravindrae]|uniref:Uncharacterized protein n=1 Tax=Apiospora rasikravindrae TaxID=990691 RepID=A0ABR1SCS8_9PEZI
MLIRETRRLVGTVCIFVLVGYIGIRLFFDNQGIDSLIGDALTSFHGDAGPAPLAQPASGTSTSQDHSNPQGLNAIISVLEEVDPFATHNEVFSVSTKDKKFFYIKFGAQKAINPNIIPHPLRENTWIIVAQKYKGPEDQQTWFTEIVCSATFTEDGTLACDESNKDGTPSTLPIAATSGDKCDGDLAYFGLNVGPHDARVFFGPRAPYALYGSQSAFTCFGQWLQDFRLLFPWGLDMSQEHRFRLGTELQRPAVDRPSVQQQYFRVEKNWFLFWDRDDRVYAHYDVAPRRVFAALQENGAAGPDLAPLAQPVDEKCLARHLPKLAPTLESIHQSTNSLAITLCRRTDLSCEPSANNTFVFTIFQHKSFYDFHGVYEPYVLLFRQRAPFEVYGISTKPVWIHGREQQAEPRQSQMFYVVSMSWKARGQKYHGYLDDVLFLAFGIEDENTGGIDVLASDLLRGLGLCSDV